MYRIPDKVRELFDNLNLNGLKNFSNMLDGFNKVITYEQRPVNIVQISSGATSAAGPVNVSDYNQVGVFIYNASTTALGTVTILVGPALDYETFSSITEVAVDTDSSNFYQFDVAIFPYLKFEVSGGAMDIYLFVR